MANYRRRKPALGWGGERFLESAASEVAGGSWAGGTVVAPVDFPPASGGSPLTFTLNSVGAGTNNALDFDSAALGVWADTLTNETRDGRYDLTVTGLTPGDAFSWRATIVFISDTVPGAGVVVLSTVGVTTSSLTVPRGDNTTLFVNGAPLGIVASLTTEVPPSGTVVIRVYVAIGGSHSLTMSLRDVAWGTPGTGSRPNLLVWGTPAGLGRVTTWPRMGGGSARSDRFPGGRRARWSKPEYDVLALPMPYIPQTDRLRVGGPNGLDASGADGAAGVRAALEYGHDGGHYTFYPDQDDLALDAVDCFLEAPMAGAYERGDSSLLRSVDWVLRTLTSGDVFPEY